MHTETRNMVESSMFWLTLQWETRTERQEAQTLGCGRQHEPQLGGFEDSFAPTFRLPGIPSSLLLLQTISAFSVNKSGPRYAGCSSGRKTKGGKEMVHRFLCILFPLSYLFLLLALLFHPPPPILPRVPGGPCIRFTV